MRAAHEEVMSDLSSTSSDHPPIADLDPGIAPAGTYFVGDPCYAMSHDEWDAMLDQSGLADQDGAGVAAMPNGTVRRMWMQGTRDGDGTYEDGDGREFCVDSGTLGLVPKDEIDPALHEGLERLGAFVTFTSPVAITKGDDGVITFGHVRINTGDPDPETCFECGREEDHHGFCAWCGHECEHCNQRGCDGDCYAAEVAAEDED